MKYSAVILLLSGLAGAQAQGVISWNVDTYGTISGSSQYAGVVSAAYWNDTWVLNGNATGASVNYANLIDNTGAATTLSLTAQSLQNGWNFYSIQGSHPGQDADGTYNKELLNGYNNKGSSESPYASIVSLSSIPYSAYDIYVYFSADTAGRTGTANIGSTTYDFATLGAASVSGGNAVLTQTTDTTGANPGADYAVFSGLTGSSDTITVSIPNWGGIAGIQIVQTPEPGTLALFGAGAGALVLGWSRRTRRS